MAPKLPSLLRINGRDVELRPRPEKDLPDAFGQWWEAKDRIDYRTRQTPLILRDTILHETFHAIRSLQGRESGGEVEEDYVRSLATGLIGVLRDNPSFTKWLTSFPNESPRKP